MALTTAERVLAGLAAAYFAYRFWTGTIAGVIDGEGDMDVHADRHPTAFVLTALSLVSLFVICSAIVVGPNIGDVQRISAWLRKS